MKQRHNRIIALAAALMMTAGALVSCGSEDKSSDKNDNAVSGSKTSVSAPASGNSGSTSKTENTPETRNGEKTDDNYTSPDGSTEAEIIMPSENMAKSEMAYDALGGSRDMITIGSAGGEEYKNFTENGFKLVSEAPLSTFSTDVDTASYTNVRRMLNSGLVVYPDAVRTEEFINYFNYDYPEPTDDYPVSITTELSDFNDKGTKLLLVGLKAKEIKQETRPSMNIVLLIDVSGSMYSENKLPLAKTAFKVLAENLDANDRVSIVTYSGMEKIVLEGAKGSEYDRIAAALDSLEASGSTAGEAGIKMAYKLAEKNFIKGGNNRIVMATDGDLNVGISSEEELKKLVEEKREGGVNLSVLGFGTGNLKDDRLEALADNGNGNYSYIDSEREAKKVLVAELQGTLFTVAKDVKAQIRFNPETVSAYRQIGYENRALNDEDFTDDTKDAGDMGSGHTVTILYEIVPAKGVLGSNGGADIGIDVNTAPAENGDPETLATVSIRCKQPDDDTSTEISKKVGVSEYTEKKPANLAFAYCVAGFADFLRKGSESSFTTDHLLEELVGRKLVNDEYREELVELIKMAETIYKDYTPIDYPNDNTD